MPALLAPPARLAPSALPSASACRLLCQSFIYLIIHPPVQCGRADGYILEGRELEFYVKKMQKKKVRSGFGGVSVGGGAANEPSILGGMNIISPLNASPRAAGQGCRVKRRLARPQPPGATCWIGSSCKAPTRRDTSRLPQGRVTGLDMLVGDWAGPARYGWVCGPLAIGRPGWRQVVIESGQMGQHVL